jgi:hypothetical protein
MGRNLESTTQLVQDLVAQIKPLAELLAPMDRLILQRFTEHMLQQRVAIANATGLLPLEAALLVLLLEEHKHTNRLTNELYGWLQELDGRHNELRQRLEQLERELRALKAET